MMKKSLLLVLFSSSIIFSCKKSETVVPVTKSEEVATATCPVQEINFYGGQHTLVGNISVTNDNQNLYVTYNTTTEGWKLKLTHLYVGNLAGLPASSKGNPEIGQFPYQTDHNPFVTSFTYTIPLSTLPQNECLVIASHAEAVLVDENDRVLKRETAWGSGTRMGNDSWAMYSEYCPCTPVENNNTGGSDDNTGSDGSDGTETDGTDGSGDTGGGDDGGVVIIN